MAAAAAAAETTAAEIPPAVQRTVENLHVAQKADRRVAQTAVRPEKPLAQRKRSRTVAPRERYVAEPAPTPRIARQIAEEAKLRTEEAKVRKEAERLSLIHISEPTRR